MQRIGVGINGIKKKMSKEAFKEVIDNIEIISNMTLYRRIGIKQNVKKLWAEIKELKSDLYEANNIISDYIDVTAKQNKMIEILLDLYWNKEQARLFIEYGLENKEQLRKEIEKKAEES